MVRDSTISGRPSSELAPVSAVRGGGAVVYLASDPARFVTGIDLPVDGGHSAGTDVAGFDAL